MRTHAPHIARATTARALAALALAGLLASCTSAPRYTRHPETAAPGPQSIVSIGDTTVTVTGRDVVGHAQNYLGTPYRNGGTTTGGMDCSGLVFHVYRSFGIALPRTSSAQSRFGAQVPRSDLQPGDLLFFDVNGRGISHVGIYSGGGEFIHASNRDRRVRFDRLDNKYFKNRFILARRVL